MDPFQVGQEVSETDGSRHEGESLFDILDCALIASREGPPQRSITALLVKLNEELRGRVGLVKLEVEERSTLHFPNDIARG